MVAGTDAGIGLLGEGLASPTGLLTTLLLSRTRPPSRWARTALVRAAVTAWEAAHGWTVEPSYARRQLMLRRSGTQSFD
jgi:hypothetical protein